MRRGPSPSALTIAAVATTIAVLFAAVMIWFTDILPAINHREQPATSTVPAAPVPARDAARWSGVAQLTGDGSCTGVLLDTGADSGPAYLLTAGHCSPVRTLDPNTVITDRPTTTATATFRLVSGVQPLPVPVARTAYATMKGTDVAVLTLDATLGRLRSEGIRGYGLVAVTPGSGADLVNVAVPASGLAPAETVLRSGICRSGPSSDLVEGGWLFDQLMAVTCPGVIGGSSGSPLFNHDDQVVGLLTTTTAGAPPGAACGVGAPCRRTAAGVALVPDQSYAVPAADLAGCFENGQFVAGPRCPLPPAGPTFGLGRTVLSTAALRQSGGRVPVVVIARPSAPVRVGVQRLTATADCARAKATPQAVRVTARPAGTAVAVQLPAVEGFYLLCATPEHDPTQAASAVFQLDDTPPRVAPQVQVSSAGGGLVVSPQPAPPELVAFRVKVGPESGTDCHVDNGYQAYRGGGIQVPAADLPAMVCVIGYDQAGNAGAPTARLLTR